MTPVYPLWYWKVEYIPLYCSKLRQCRSKSALVPVLNLFLIADGPNLLISKVAWCAQGWQQLVLDLPLNWPDLSWVVQAMTSIELMSSRLCWWSVMEGRVNPRSDLISNAGSISFGCFCCFLIGNLFPWGRKHGTAEKIYSYLLTYSCLFNKYTNCSDTFVNIALQAENQISRSGSVSLISVPAGCLTNDDLLFGV